MTSIQWQYLPRNLLEERIIFLLPHCLRPCRKGRCTVLFPRACFPTISSSSFVNPSTCEIHAITVSCSLAFPVYSLLQNTYYLPAIHEFSDCVSSGITFLLPHTDFGTLESHMDDLSNSLEPRAHSLFTCNDFLLHSTCSPCPAGIPLLRHHSQP